MATDELPPFGVCFDGLLDEMDKDLRYAGHAIPIRPMVAWITVAQRFHLSLPLGKPVTYSPSAWRTTGQLRSTSISACRSTACPEGAIETTSA